MDRYLLALFAILAATAVAVTVPRRAPDVSHPVSLDGMPREVDGWVAAGDALDHVLPDDPRAIESVHRRYVKAGRVVLLAAARYPSGDPSRRPTLDRLVVDQNLGFVARDVFPVALNGGPGATITLNRLTWRRGNRQLTAIYWYDLGGAVIAGDYHLRAQLFLDSLRGRRRELAVVRVASDSPDVITAFLHAVRPYFLRTVAH